MEIPELRPAAEVITTARAILAHEQARLAALLGEHELALVGGSSVPGALTKGDVDLHLRVPAAGFGAAVAALREIYVVVRPEIWQESLATFEVPGAPLPTGVAVTPVGSEHDTRFRRGWQLLAADPALVDAYNAMKLRHRDRPEKYEQRKSAFFDMFMDPR
ncbi:GrpB family protein [Actinoplanes sp. NPDC048967]|uniref:GrpB family protein n=1 Tax=Actinoplanes sp. NPDC048967 TaxID=3155269 RepID=UPI0033E94A1C